MTPLGKTMSDWAQVRDSKVAKALEEARKRVQYAIPQCVFGAQRQHGPAPSALGLAPPVVSLAAAARLRSSALSFPCPAMQTHLSSGYWTSGLWL